MVIKIKLHSAVDLITNSSTVIFTYSEGAVSKLVELVDEMLKAFGHENVHFDDLFYAQVLPDEYDDEVTLPDNYKELEVQYIKGEVPKQDWMINSTRCDYYGGGTTLHIIPKDEKYSELAKKFLTYLYSTHHAATYDG